MNIAENRISNAPHNLQSGFKSGMLTAASQSYSESDIFKKSYFLFLRYSTTENIQMAKLLS